MHTLKKIEDIDCFKDRDVKSPKQITKMFGDVLKSIRDLYPEMTQPHLSGNLSDDDQGMGSLSNLTGNEDDPCKEHSGSIEITKTTRPKPIGKGKGHKRGTGESKCRITPGDGKVLSPSSVLSSGNDRMPEFTLVVTDIKEKPVAFFSPPNRLVINSIRPSSHILTDASPKNLAILKSRVLPLLVRAGIDAFLGSSEISKEEFFEK
ncbi:MAG: hypothetical protein WBZ20_13135 [Nitrososphaeraceae archaeon]